MYTERLTMRPCQKAIVIVFKGTLVRYGILSDRWFYSKADFRVWGTSKKCHQSPLWGRPLVGFIVSGRDPIGFRLWVVPGL